MNKKIQKLANNHNYDELLKILESKITKPSLEYKDLTLSPIDFINLKKFTSECVLKHLNSDNIIPNSLIEISKLLGDDHINSLKISITNFIISKKMLEISYHIQENLNDLSDLKGIFEFIENTLETTYKEYENLPHTWNIDLKILNKSILALKHAICEYFFSNDPKPESLSEGLKATIAFEKKLEQYFNLKKCCIPSIDFYDEEYFVKNEANNIKCVHKRMISNLFIPYLDIFINHHLSKVLNEPFEQSKHEKKIIKQFIDYFKVLLNIYEFLGYFQEKSVFVDLFNLSDKILLSMIQKIKIDDESTQIMILYSTILYIQKVIEDFSNNMIENHRIECISISLASVRKLEKVIDLKIEREIALNYPEQLEKFPDIISYCFDDFLNLDDEVKKNVFEISMIQILLKIRQIKLNMGKANELLSKIINLENSLSKRFKINVNFNLLKDYVQIFTFSMNEPSLFINNFSKLSSGKFDLTQILKAFEDQQSAQEIYQAFKQLNLGN